MINTAAAPRPGRRWPRFALATLLGIAAAGGVYFYVLSLQQSNQAAVQQARQTAAATSTTTQNVVVAKQNIAAQTSLDPNAFQIQAVPVDAVQPNAISTLADLTGKVLTTPVAQGEQIVSYRLVDPTAATPPQKFGDTVPPGKRAMSVNFTELAGSGALIAPGDHVDVVGVFNKDTLGKDQAMILLQDVQVLAVGQATSVDQLARAPAANSSTAATASARTNSPITVPGTNPSAPAPTATPALGVPEALQARTLTLAVDTEAAERLALAESNGQLRYIIRPSGEREQSSVVPADLATLANPLQESAGQITAVEISPTNVKVGDTIDVKITVKNVSNQPLPTQDPQPDYTYVQGQTYFTQGFNSDPGKWRVAIGTAGLDSTDLPYRWGFGGDLAPGASTTVTGHIKVTSDFKATNFWAALVQEPSTVAQSGVGITLITSLPQNLAIIAVDVANVRSGPSIASSVIDQVKYGTQLEITGQNADWFKIKLPDQREGWVAAGWIVTASQ
jgi:Flp pilus assembly protein CpaB